MSDSDEQRKAKSLASIDHSLKQLVKVVEALNDNFVHIGKTFQDWLGERIEVGDIDLDELIEIAKDPQKAQVLRNALKEDTETD